MAGGRPPTVRARSAGSYGSRGLERTVEFSWTNSQHQLCGGVISFRPHADRLIVDVYNLDDTVELRNDAKAARLALAIHRLLAVSSFELPDCAACGGMTGHCARCPAAEAQALLHSTGYTEPPRFPLYP